mmetsp:Transcript_908/g.1729  ORF Transcript_908/g.1729 Transcript_908/m.1729 type:complete len:211 (+) Transcript_908:2857-3489(+)
MRLDLLDRVHTHRHNDQDRGAAEVSGNRKVGPHQFGQHAHKREITGTQDKDTLHHVFQIFRRPRAGANARNETVLVLQVIGHVLGFERHVEGVEICEEDNHRAKEQQVERLTGTEVREDPAEYRAGALGAAESGQRGGQQQQRRGEDRRDHARRVHLDRQVAGAPVVDLHTYLAAWVLNVDLAQRPLHEDHEDQCRNQHRDHPDRRRRGE